MTRSATSSSTAALRVWRSLAYLTPQARRAPSASGVPGSTTTGSAWGSVAFDRKAWRR